jgi:Zn-dependent protease with chaperone function
MTFPLYSDCSQAGRRLGIALKEVSLRPASSAPHQVHLLRTPALLLASFALLAPVCRAQATPPIVSTSGGQLGAGATTSPPVPLDAKVGLNGVVEGVKPGSEDDVSAIGTRNIGGRGLGNWYSTDTEIAEGKQYSLQIEKSTKFITDPVVTEYVNRIAQNLVKNSDARIPFTVRVIDSEQINAFALPGGFFFVNSGTCLRTLGSYFRSSSLLEFSFGLLVVV